MKEVRRFFITSTARIVTLFDGVKKIDAACFFVGNLGALSRVYPSEVYISSYWVGDVGLSVAQALCVPVHDLQIIEEDKPVMITRSGRPLLTFHDVTSIVNWRNDHWSPQLEDPENGYFCTCSLVFATGKEGKTVLSTFFTNDPPLDTFIQSWVKDIKGHDKYTLKLSMIEMEDVNNELVFVRHDLTVIWTGSSLERAFGSVVVGAPEFTLLLKSL